MPAKQGVIKSDLARVDKLRDEDIDYSDIPELDEQVFAQPSTSSPRKERSREMRPRRARTFEAESITIDHGSCGLTTGASAAARRGHTARRRL